VGFAFSGSGFVAGFALGEAERCVPGLDDAAVVRDAIKQGRRHLGVTEYRHPFAELEIGRDDDTGGFIQFADQMKQQRPAGFWKWNIAKLVDDDAIQRCQLLDDLSGISLSLLRDQGIDQIDGVIEPNPLALIDQVGSQGDRDMRFAGAGAANKNDVVRVLGELARAERVDLRFGDGRSAIIKGGKVLVMGEFGNAHLILNGSHAAFLSFRVDQGLQRCCQAGRRAGGQQVCRAGRHPMEPEGCKLVDEGVHAAAFPASHSASYRLQSASGRRVSCG